MINKKLKFSIKKKRCESPLCRPLDVFEIRCSFQDKRDVGNGGGIVRYMVVRVLLFEQIGLVIEQVPTADVRLPSLTVKMDLYTLSF